MTDAEVQRPVDSSKVPEKEFYDRTCPVSTDRTLGVQRPVEYSKVPVRDICDRTRPVSSVEVSSRTDKSAQYLGYCTGCLLYSTGR